jgi:hypothetical protein
VFALLRGAETQVLTSAGKKVAPMEIYTNTIQRLSLLPAVCAPMSAAWRPAHETLVVPVAERAQVSQAHQVRVQAELALSLAAAGESYGTAAFRSSNGVDSVKKPMTVGANGVPPRGRPV